MKHLKKLTYFLISCIIMLSYLSCSENLPNQQSKVTFGFNIVTDNQNLKSALELLNVAKIAIGISDEEGNIIYDLTELEVYSMNGIYISQTISLNVGSYLLTDF